MSRFDVPADPLLRIDPDLLGATARDRSVTEAETCNAIYAEVGRDFAKRFTGRRALQGADHDAVRIEASYAVLSAGWFLMQHGMSRADAECAMFEIHNSMVAEGRRLASSLTSGGGDANARH